MKVSNKLCMYICVLGGLVSMNIAHASPVTLTFTASGFGVGAPTDPVSGVIVFDAASPNDIINSIISVNLTIAGHAYGLGDTTFANLSSTLQRFGGSPGGAAGLLNNTNDFALDYNPQTLAPSSMIYLTPSGGIYSTSTFSQFSVQASAPEPTSLLLLISGALLISVGKLRLGRNRVGRS